MASDMVWETESGQQIPIKDMEDGHLLNVILFLWRRAEAIRYAEADRRCAFASMLGGEMAVDAVEAEVMALATAGRYGVLTHAISQWEPLINEAKKRGIYEYNLEAIIDAG